MMQSQLVRECLLWSSQSSPQCCPDRRTYQLRMFVNRDRSMRSTVTDVLQFRLFWRSVQTHGGCSCSSIAKRFLPGSCAKSTPHHGHNRGLWTLPRWVLCPGCRNVCTMIQSIARQDDARQKHSTPLLHDWESAKCSRQLPPDSNSWCAGVQVLLIKKLWSSRSAFHNAWTPMLSFIFA